MPNWVKNELTIRGNIKDIKALIDRVHSDKSEFDFNKVIHMPEELDISSGSNEKHSIMYYIANSSRKEVDIVFDLLKESDDFSFELYYSKYKNMPLEAVAKEVMGFADGYSPDDKEKEMGIKSYYDLGKRYIDNLKNYGATTWYDWCIKNWGTKWNASDSKSGITDDGEGYAHFETAWSTPTPVIDKLALEFPKLEIVLKYADEDLGSNCGYLMFKNKKIFKRYFKYNAETFRFACDLWSTTPEEEGYIINDTGTDYFYIGEQV